MIVAREATLARVGRGARRGWGAGAGVRVVACAMALPGPRCAQRAGGKNSVSNGKSVSSDQPEIDKKW